jgi:hypothetical protein
MIFSDTTSEKMLYFRCGIGKKPFSLDVIFFRGRVNLGLQDRKMFVGLDMCAKFQVKISTSPSN